MTVETNGSTSPGPEDPATVVDVAHGMIARLHLVATALNDVVDDNEVVELIVRQGMAGLDADGGVLATVRDDGLLHAAATVGYPGGIVRRYLPMPLHIDTPLTRAVTTDQAVFVATTAERAAFAGLRGTDTGMVALAALPLTVEGDTFGALGVSFRTDRPLGETERLYLRTLADMCASAFARLDRVDDSARSTDAARSEASPLSSALNELRLGAMHLTTSAGELSDTEDGDLALTVTAALEQMNGVVEEIHARALAASIWYDDPII